MIGFFSQERVTQERPAGLEPKCGACGLFRTCKSPKMRPYGKGRAKVLVVGEAPGESEDEAGRPFVGKAGKLLRETLREIDVNLDRDAWTTNSLICRPPSNRTPDEKQLSYCRPNLTRTLEECQPNVVITLGRSALASMLMGSWHEVGVLERWVGWRIPMKSYWLCPTYHPAFLLRLNNRMVDRAFSEHLEAAFALEKPPPEQPNWKSMVELIFEEDKAVRAVQEMHRAGGWLAVDYETNCLKPEWPEARVVSCALSNGHRTVSYPWMPGAAKATGEMLADKRTKKIASNLKMEERWTRQVFGHGVANWGWDTMLAAHCLDNRPGICSIKFQAFVKLGVPIYNRHVEPFLMSSRGPYNRVHEIPPMDLLLYGGLDALLEYCVAAQQRKEMGHED